MEEQHATVMEVHVSPSEVELSVGEGLELGELDLEGLEAAVAKNKSREISPSQVSLLEKAILMVKTHHQLGMLGGSPKEIEGKKKWKGDKRGRPTCAQIIHNVGQKLINSGKYPTIEAALNLQPQYVLDEDHNLEYMRLHYPPKDSSSKKENRNGTTLGYFSSRN